MGQEEDLTQSVWCPKTIEADKLWSVNDIWTKTYVPQ